MDIAVTGSTGLIGTSLLTALRHAGHRVLPMIRPDSENVSGEGIPWDITTGRIDAGALEGIDAVVHLAGAGIGDKRWTPQRKRIILDSRVDGTRLLADTLAALSHPPKVLLSGSAVGFYGDTGDTPTDESAGAGDDFPAKVCLAWEKAADPAVGAGLRVAFLRTGIVLSTEGGALARQLPLFRLGLGGRAGKGTQYQSWISIADEVAAIVHLLGDCGVQGPVNLTAPEPVTNWEFTKTLGRVLHRPTTVLPMFGPRLLFGSELANSLLLTSQRVVPTVLQRSGFEFAHPQLDGALKALLG